MRPEASRTIRLAARAARSSESELEHALTHATTHIRIQPDLPGALPCGALLAATLLRGPGQLTIDPTGIPEPSLAHLQQLALAIRPGQPLALGPPAANATEIAIGERAGEIAVIPDNHGARLARGTRPSQQRPPSILGVLLAAALAAGEAFKDAAQISGEHAVRHQDLAFCPVTLTADLTTAPAVPTDWRPEITLAGVGAIGSAHALLLAGLTGPGDIVLIDRQRYAAENLGTYTLGEHADIRAATPKVALAERAFPGWCHYPHHGDITTALTAIDEGRLPWTPLVLAGLDNNDARRETQRLQPDRLLDAATGDTAVGLRDTRPDGPCLHCMLETPTARPSPTKALTDLGIPLALAKEPGEAVVTDQIIASASSEHARELLRSQRGAPICGLLRAAGLTEIDEEDYMPSVPFVSQQAACLTVGRLLAIQLGIDAGLANFFQYDTLIGPHRAILQHRHADPACACQQRAEIISAVRDERRQRPRA
jgi:molybdopterin/thiamine biosynthesis adenylyltransferase